jgi:hypothetical protein
METRRDDQTPDVDRVREELERLEDSDELERATRGDTPDDDESEGTTDE